MFLTVFTGTLAVFLAGVIGFGLGVEWAEAQQAKLEQNRRDWDKAFAEERARIAAHHAATEPVEVASADMRALSDATGYGFCHPEYRKGQAPDFYGRAREQQSGS